MGSQKKRINRSMLQKKLPPVTVGLLILLIVFLLWPSLFPNKGSLRKFHDAQMNLKEESVGRSKSPQVSMIKKRKGKRGSPKRRSKLQSSQGQKKKIVKVIDPPSKELVRLPSLAEEKMIRFCDSFIRAVEDGTMQFDFQLPKLSNLDWLKEGERKQVKSLAKAWKKAKIAVFFERWKAGKALIQQHHYWVYPRGEDDQDFLEAHPDVYVLPVGSLNNFKGKNVNVATLIAEDATPSMASSIRTLRQLKRKYWKTLCHAFNKMPPSKRKILIKSFHSVYLKAGEGGRSANRKYVQFLESHKIFYYYPSSLQVNMSKFELFPKSGR